jgi:hypothetical protein
MLSLIFGIAAILEFLIIVILWVLAGPCQEYIKASLAKIKPQLLMVTFADNTSRFLRGRSADGKIRTEIDGKLYDWLQLEAGGTRFGAVQLQHVNDAYGVLTDPNKMAAIEAVQEKYGVKTNRELLQAIKDGVAPNGEKISKNDEVLVPLFTKVNVQSVAFWSGMTPRSRGESVESTYLVKTLINKNLTEKGGGFGGNIGVIALLAVIGLAGLALLLGGGGA